jgi:hypothetical protein
VDWEGVVRMRRDVRRTRNLAAIISIIITALFVIICYLSITYYVNNIHEFGYGYTIKEAQEYCKSIGYEYYDDIKLNEHFNCCREEIKDNKFEKVCVAGKWKS